MAKSVVVEQSRAIPVQSEDAFGGTLAAALPVICSHWYGLIPPIKEVRDQTGAWDSVGQARVITMVGGGRVREELTSVDPPRSFGYTLTDIKGPLAPLVALVEGKWSFAPADTGTTGAGRAGVAGVRQDVAGLRARGAREAFRFVGGLSGAAGFVYRRGHVPTLWLALRNRCCHRDVLVAERLG